MNHPYTVTFLPENITLSVPPATTVLEAQRLAGLSPDAPCGGRGTCKKCKVLVEKNGTSETVLACATPVTEEMVIRNPNHSAYRILTKGISREIELNPETGSSETDFFQVAFDLGTTTLVGYLIDPKTGIQLGVASAMNPQAQYGADVIQRANYVLEHGGEQMASCVREALNDLIRQLCQMTNITPAQILQLSVVGNSCMQHLLLNLPVDTLVKAPYHPVFYDGYRFPARKLGLPVHPDAFLLILPNIGGFVGSDTVGCMVAADFAHLEKQSLLIDIGTNGELVMGNRHRRMACSTAAGPALEGAKITCGMRSAKGAIDHVWLRDGCFQYSTIDQAAPIGLCGSGLLDLTALLLQHGFIDSFGHLQQPEELEIPFYRQNKNRLQRIDGLWSFVLVPAGEAGNNQEVFLNQKDIREVQLAKAAIAAGIACLAKQLKLSLTDLEQVWIAGAFGNYMDVHSACTIGLLPKILEKRILPIGNAAGEGAKIVLLNQKEYRRVNDLAKATEFLELAGMPEFQELFIDHLEFPI